jgi:hypothetical protein
MRSQRSGDQLLSCPVIPSTENKGQMWAFVPCVISFVATKNYLPTNLMFSRYSHAPTEKEDMCSVLIKWILVGTCVPSRVHRLSKHSSLLWHITHCSSYQWPVCTNVCGLVVSVADYKHRGPGFDSRALLRIFLRELGLERGPLGLVIG